MKPILLLIGLAIGLIISVGFPMWLGARGGWIGWLVLPMIALIAFDGRNVNRYNQLLRSFIQKENRLSTVFWLYIASPLFRFGLLAVFYWLGALLIWPTWPNLI